MPEFKLPGRLGDPGLTLAKDPRIDPRIGAMMEAAEGASFMSGLEPISSDSSYDECIEYCRAAESADQAMHAQMDEMMPSFDDIESSTEVIKGVNENDIMLYIDRPKNLSEKVPCVLHTHGGGMIIMTATDPVYRRWRKSLAQKGVVTVGVEFRNGAGSLGNHPFPAGLNDCASAARWICENKEALGVGSLIISGESGGGNLAIATTLKALREGWVDQIDGVYALCPYISGAYANPPAELLSLTENDAYLLDCGTMAGFVKVYDPDNSNANNPLAWPLLASKQELSGLPPHVISVNELDPLRDEGLEFFRKLLGAGVSVSARTVHGTPHGGDVGFVDVAPEHARGTLDSIYAFARSLS